MLLLTNADFSIPVLFVTEVHRDFYGNLEEVQPFVQLLAIEICLKLILLLFVVYW